MPQPKYPVHPEPNPMLSKWMKNYLRCKLPANLFKYNEEVRMMPNDLKPAIQISLGIFDDICNGGHGCGGGGNHTMWFVAGGFASYMVRRTSTFTDVDVFVFCNGEIKVTKNYEPYNVEKFGDSVVNISKDNGLVIQLIQVNFFENSIPDFKSDVFLEMMITYVLSRFDLPVCRVAMKFPLEEESTSIGIIDMSYSDKTHKTTQHRINKYKQRKLQQKLPNFNLRDITMLQTCFNLNAVKEK